MYISIEQALSLYDELVLAKYGENRFGGDTAEVYAYKFMPNKPGYSNAINSEDNIPMEKKAAEELCSICEIFSDKHDVNIKINDVPANIWLNRVRADLERFSWRIHITVIKIKTQSDESKGEVIDS